MCNRNVIKYDNYREILRKFEWYLTKMVTVAQPLWNKEQLFKDARPIPLSILLPPVLSYGLI